MGNCECDINCYKDILKIFELYSTGSYTFSSLADLMAKKGITNYKGKTIKFSKQLIQHILNNPFYIGILKVKINPIKACKHKPLISTSLWQKCQNLQNKKNNHIINHRLIENPDFPLRRFTVCGFCNHPLTACWSKGGSGGKYPYYYCVNKVCPKNSLNEFNHEELDFEPILDKGIAFIQTLEKGWQEALPENKIKLQRLIYPACVSYQYSGFSNSENELPRSRAARYHEMPSNIVN